MASLHFEVAYPTTRDQHLCLQIGPCVSELESHHEIKSRTERNTVVWTVQVLVDTKDRFKYRYVLLNEAGLHTKSENTLREILVEDCIGEGEILQLQDTWQDPASQYSVLASSIFGAVIGLAEEGDEMAQVIPRPVQKRGEIVVHFIVRDWNCRGGDGGHLGMFVSGSLHQLGQWQNHRAFPLIHTHDDFWEGKICVDSNLFPFTYKFGFDRNNGFFLECGESHSATLHEDSEQLSRLPSMTVLDSGYFRHEKLWKGVGVAVPVYSMRTKRSMGVGDFSDLKILVDMCVTFGLDVIHLMLVNDADLSLEEGTSMSYLPTSVFALNPIYINIDNLFEDESFAIDDLIEEEIIGNDIECKRKQLNVIEVDYEATIRAKMELAHKIYQFSGRKTLKSNEFTAFFESNKEWLQPYAAFIYLQGQFKTTEHWKWEKLATPSEEDIAWLVSPKQPQYSQFIGFTYWLQYYLHKQLHSVKIYAEQNKVALKGELPIGVSKRGVDTWAHPSLFRRNRSTGTMPDTSNPNGQNWFFPPYNWEQMEEGGHVWWRKRLLHMSEYAFVLY